MGTQAGITERLARFTCQTGFADFPEETVRYAKQLILSCLGATVVGSLQPAGKIISKHVKDWGGAPEAGVVGCGFRTSAPIAALANNVFAHATELEDDSFPEGVISYTIVPPVLALAEQMKLPGKKILEGYVIGYEIQARMALACLSARSRGFLLAGTMGAIGTAASSAKMLGLDVKRTAMALGIAASQGRGFRQQAGTMTHYLDTGASARDGLMAGMLAKAGFTCRPDIIEGPYGLCNAISGEGGWNLEEQIEQLGKPFRVMAVCIRKYPCCGLLQRIIDGVLQMKEEHDICWDDVENIEVEVGEFFAQQIRYPDPRNESEARLSVEHSIAAAFLEKKVFLDVYTEEKALDSKYKEARKKVKVIVHPEWDASVMFSAVNPVTIKLRDGTEYGRECRVAKGDTSLPLTEEEVVDKFRSCAQSLLSDDQIRRVAELVLSLEEVKDVTELMNILTAADRAL